MICETAVLMVKYICFQDSIRTRSLTDKAAAFEAVDRGSIPFECTYAPVAQLVEQLPLKEIVVGSNPTGRTRFCISCRDL